MSTTTSVYAAQFERIKQKKEKKLDIKNIWKDNIHFAL